ARCPRVRRARARSTAPVVICSRSSRIRRLRTTRCHRTYTRSVMTAPERSGASVTGPAPLGWLRAAVTDRESLRSWTQVANDGIIATAGILEGFAGAGASSKTLITAGTTATIAGMLSVGGVEWAEAAAERDAQLM